jgi:ABC-type polysaccharide/polyol phosphate export permease
MTIELQVVEYDSAARRSSSLTELVELVRYRDLVQMMVANIVKTRYKRSALGVVWTLLNPLLNMAVLTLAFSALFSNSLMHYSVDVLTGLIFWNFFAQTTL